MASQMPVARSKAQHLPVTATDLLACDEGQLVQYLKQNRAQEGFDISSLVGVRTLAKSQRDELAQKLSDAALQIERGVDVDELFTRLTGLADRRDDSSSPEPRRWPDESAESTPPPISFHIDEVSNRDGLIEAGGRPVCSAQELWHILAEPTTRHTAILSWLSDGPDTETGAGELKTVFSRQLAQWWIFRKSQWSNRGLDDDKKGLSAFLAVNRRKNERMGAYAMVSAPSFNETLQNQWQRMPAPRQLPDGQPFSVYKDAVQTRLRPYHFTRRLQLKKNPHQQDVWTDWLEYLNFEKWYLELLTAAAESLNQQFLKSWELLSVKESNNNITSGSGRSMTSAFTQVQRLPSVKAVDHIKKLKAIQAERDASNSTIRDFIRDTKPYKRAQAAAYYQRHRVEWVVREARLMETEMSQQGRTAESNSKDDSTRESRKRRRDDEEEKEIPPESQSKRAKGRVGSEKNAAPGATRDRSHTRSLRRSARLRTGV